MTSQFKSQFSIRDLMLMTLGCAVLVALTLRAGLEGAITLGILAFVFAPTLAFVIACYVTARQRKISFVIPCLLLILFMVCVSASFLISPTSSKIVFLGTCWIWTPQFVLIGFIYRAWKTGLEVAGLDLAEPTL